MIGAIVGDIIGSRFEFIGFKSEVFELFGGDKITSQECDFTDDSVMTIAVADAILRCPSLDEEEFKRTLIERMHHFGQKYINRGYGGRFYHWILNKENQPYSSFGNGSAMRCAPSGYCCDTLEDTLKIAKYTSEVSHNHIEGIKGAQCVAAVIFMARNGQTKDEIKEYVKANFYPKAFDKTLDEIRPYYKFNETCQETVPEAVLAFMEADSFEDTIRKAISLGGDADTIADIAGAMAEAFYGIPENIKLKALSYLPDDMKDVVYRFTRRFVD